MDMERKMSERLTAAAQLVRRGGVVADIGTDHGLLACYLVESGTCPKVYACDINPLPLEKAREAAARAGLSGRVETVLTDGLSGLSGKGITDIVILGMGGDLIGEILCAAAWVRDPSLRFVLGPMTKTDHLRRTLCAEGFFIEGERAVWSGAFGYSLFSVSYTGERREADDLFAWTGRLWYNEADAVSGRLLAMTAEKLQKKAEGLARSRKSREEAAHWRGLSETIRKRAEELCRQRKTSTEP